MMSARVSLALFLSLGACAEKAAPRPIAVTTLGGESVARVGDETIPASFVARVAAAQHIDARSAALLLIDDALAAQGAIDAGLERDSVLRWQLVSARARTTITHFRDEAQAAGPPSDAELAELTAARWREFDLPDQIRVVHAVAQRPAKPDSAAEQRTKAVAEQIARAVADAASVDDFISRAKAVPAPKVTVTVEPLPAFVADGRMSEADGLLDPVFAAAAFEIRAPGETSRVVETKFGWHVIRLVDRLPGKRVSAEQRRIALTEDGYAMRASRALDERIFALHHEHPVEVSTASEKLMSAVADLVASPPKDAP